MAIRDDFTAGEVLAAADLNDTFADKAPLTSPVFTTQIAISGTFPQAIFTDTNASNSGASINHDGGILELNADYNSAVAGSGIRLKVDDVTRMVINEATRMSGQWTAYTPTLTNWTIGGGGTITGAYCRVGRFVVARVQLIFGTSPGTSGNPRISVPFAVRGNDVNAGINSSFLDASAGSYYYGSGIWVDGTSFAPRSIASNIGLLSELDTSTPFAWAVSDRIVSTVTFETFAD